MKRFWRGKAIGFLIYAYVFLILTGLGIGTYEYVRYETAAVVTGGGEVETEENGSDMETESDTQAMQPKHAAEEIPAQIALTFDDGPHPVYTAQLLEGLRKRGVRASFFLIGENIPGNEELVRQMAKDGHLIGNHTWSHVRLTDLDAVSACEEITKTSELVKQITGKDTEYIRPPFGSWDSELECGFAMFPVLWSVDTRDWTTENTDAIVEKVVKEVQDSDIILLHDYYESSVEAALRIVDLLQAQGYEFVTVDQLIFD